MSTVRSARPKRRGYAIATSARAQQLVARRRELAAQGKIKLGRQKGALNKETIARITSHETFIEEVEKRAGIIADDLLRNSKRGDTNASKTLLEHTWGKPKEKKDININTFSLVMLADARSTPHALPSAPQTAVRALPPAVETGFDVEE